MSEIGEGKGNQSKHLEIRDEVNRLESQVDRLYDLFRKIVGEPQDDCKNAESADPTLCEILTRTSADIRLQSDRVRELRTKFEEALY